MSEEQSDAWASMGQGISAPIDHNQAVLLTNNNGRADNVFFGGSHDLPFRGTSAAPPMMKQEEVAALTEVWDCHVRVFDTNTAKDMEVYSKVCDSVAKGLCTISVELHQWVPDTKSWKIFLRWIEKYLEKPNQWKKGVEFKQGHLQLD